MDPRQEYRMKVILSIMHECSKDSPAGLEIWKMKFSDEMINPENCLDVILFLNDCHRSVEFVASLKKLSSSYLIQYWPYVQNTKRWNEIRTEPNFLVEIFEVMMENLKNLVTSTKEIGNNYEIVFVYEKFNNAEKLQINRLLCLTRLQSINMFFDHDLMILHNFWVQARFDFRAEPRTFGKRSLNLDGLESKTYRTVNTCCRESEPVLMFSFRAKMYFLVIFIFLIFSLGEWMMTQQNQLAESRVLGIKNKFPGPYQCICISSNRTERYCAGFHIA